jgi:hypothetical protein
MLCVLFNPAHKMLIIKHSIQDCNDCDSAENVLIQKTEKVSAEMSALCRWLDTLLRHDPP